MNLHNFKQDWKGMKAVEVPEMTDAIPAGPAETAYNKLISDGVIYLPRLAFICGYQVGHRAATSNIY